MLLFEERGKPEYPGEKPLAAKESRNQQQTNNLMTASIQDRVMTRIKLLRHTGLVQIFGSKIQDFFRLLSQIFFPDSGLSNRCRDQYRPLKKQEQSFFHDALQTYKVLVAALKKLKTFCHFSRFYLYFPEV